MGINSQSPIRPFKIQFSEQKIEAMMAGVRSAKIPDNLDDDDAGAGLKIADYKLLLEYWKTKFNWAEEQNALNQFSQFLTEIQGVDLHFIHERSRHERATAILILHGWPSTPFEFRKVIPEMTDPKRPEDAFHVVAPSLPGFLFSQTIPGLDYTKAATLFMLLMDRLGYDKYIVGGSDFSYPIACMIASKDAGRHCIGLYVQGSVAIPRFSIWTPFQSLKNLVAMLWPLPRYDRLKVRAQIRNWAEETAYMFLHATKPRTVGIIAAQSPVAVAIMIGEKLITWSDSTGIAIDESMSDDERLRLYPVKLDMSRSRLELSQLSIDEILSTIALYWLSDSVPTSIWLYRNSLWFNVWAIISETDVTKVPVAMSEFSCDFQWGPPPISRQSFPKFVQHKVHLNGGHFAALEQPKCVLEDLVNFNRHIYGQSSA